MPRCESLRRAWRAGALALLPALAQLPAGGAEPLGAQVVQLIYLQPGGTFREGEVSGYNFSVYRRVDATLYSQGELVVYYELSGSATEGADYEIVRKTASPAGTFLFPDGTERTFYQVKVVDDDLVEGTEELVLQLVPGEGSALLNSGRFVLRIEDDDSAPNTDTGADPAPPPSADAPPPSADAPPSTTPPAAPAPLPPTLSRLSPASARAGRAITLVVHGSGFAPDARVHWGTTPLPTTFVGPTELRAEVSSALLSASRVGRVEIAVENPGAGGRSTALTFTVERPGGGPSGSGGARAGNGRP